MGTCINLPQGLSFVMSSERYAGTSTPLCTGLQCRASIHVATSDYNTYLYSESEFLASNKISLRAIIQIPMVCDLVCCELI